MDNDPQFKDKDGSALRIWRDAAKNEFLSEQEGRAIFDEIILVEVISPGSKGSTPTFEVERTFAPEAEKHNLPKERRGTKYAQYAEFINAFKADDAQGAMAGTPLKEWQEITRSMAASLREARVFTVEGLAALPDEKLRVVGPDGRTWREKARGYLEISRSGGISTAMVSELERMKTELADRDRQIKELDERISTLSKQPANTKPKTAVEPSPAII